MADEIVRDVRMDVLLGMVDEVHTLTSLTGFEALPARGEGVVLRWPLLRGLGAYGRLCR